jgi:hypothetical protein
MRPKIRGPVSLLEVHRPPLDDIDWNALDAFGDRVFSQRRHWLEFIAAFTQGRGLVAQLHRGAEVVGYFSGIRFRRFGIAILGSPFRGWTTPYMGFNLAPDVLRIEALGALERFVFSELAACTSRSRTATLRSRMAPRSDLPIAWCAPS